MYLHRISSENFRVFGSKALNVHLDLQFNQGLNLLVGENDSGKTSIVDAVRYALLTTSYEYLRLQEQDFHIEGTIRSDTLWIEAEFRGLSVPQQAAVLEWLTYEDGKDPYLVIHLWAKLHSNLSSRRNKIEVAYLSGTGGVGPEIGNAVRDLVRATYLRPLRDAEAELRPGRQSRLSQVLYAHKNIAGQEKSDFDPAELSKQPTTLVGYMDQAQHFIGKSPVIEFVETSINDDYLAKVAFDGDALTSRIKVASEISLQQILERLELSLSPPKGVDANNLCPRGLGYNNVLFMSTELVLLGDGDELALLLIEEPEAHLHPQLQTRLLELFKKYASQTDHPVQVILSTHSPNLAAAAPVENMTLVANGKPYRLVKGQTALEDGDYSYLGRFLDVTKANFFFARGVLVVEGPAEALLLPALAEACGRSFSGAGISIVNVGSVGLFRYARILQRKDGTQLPIPVACITDRDIVPSHIDYVERSKYRKFSNECKPEEIDDIVSKLKARAEGGSTKVFVSDVWTLEYDLAQSGAARLMHDAVFLASKAGAEGFLSDVDKVTALAEAKSAWETLEKDGATVDQRAADIYKPLCKGGLSKAITAQFAAELALSKEYGTGDTLFHSLPKYLQEAISHLLVTNPA
ncbi:MAG: AAA family ATPase [Methylophilaceae bacterium]|nr:AAA family ATPase [Methylophilaceae bacterium]